MQIEKLCMVDPGIEIKYRQGIIEVSHPVKSELKIGILYCKISEEFFPDHGSVDRHILKIVAIQHDGIDLSLQEKIGFSK